MTWHLWFIKGVSLVLMAGVLFLAFSGQQRSVDLRFFCSIVGIMGWFVGNALTTLDRRITEAERRLKIEYEDAA